MFKKISPRRSSPLQGQFKDLYGMMDDFFTENINFSANTNFKVDVRELENSYLVEAELPGFKKDEIKISFKNGELTIDAEKKEEAEKSSKDKNYVHREMRYSSMSRTLYFENVEKEGLKAKLNDGILEINIPKTNSKSEDDYINID